MKSFVYSPFQQRVVFGSGSLATLASELRELDVRRVLVLATPNQRDLAQQVAALIPDQVAGIYDGAVMHVPIEVARDATTYGKELGADCALAVGGGSTIGLGKAMALVSDLPIVAIPTTYAGSEMTPIYGITEAGVKKTGRDPRVLPRTVIYDPDLSLELPLGMSVTSGFNAIAHAAEGLYAADANPIISMIGTHGIEAIAQALPSLMANSQDELARSNALKGAWLCGTVLGSVSMGLHHKLCHTLGGSFNLPHAETHTIVLPHALAYNAASAPGAMAAVAKALNVDSAPAGVFDLAQRCGAPLALREIGMQESDLDYACTLALKQQYPNPRPLEIKALRQLLQDAFDGRRPSRFL